MTRMRRGELQSSVPSGYPVNPVTGEGWEGVGVQPDVAVAAAEALPTAHRLALEHVLTLGSDGHRAATFDEAVQALES